MPVLGPKRADRYGKKDEVLSVAPVAVYAVNYNDDEGVNKSSLVFTFDHQGHTSLFMLDPRVSPFEKALSPVTGVMRDRLRPFLPVSDAPVEDNDPAADAFRGELGTVEVVPLRGRM